MSSLPSVNGLVHIVLDETRVYASRMEDVDGSVLTVAAPMGVGDLDVPGLGDSFDIAWVDERSRYAVPVKLLALTRDRPPRWQVEMVGDPRQSNRRLFVRGGGGEPVRLAPAGGLDRGREVTGHVVDVSEGGVRCRVPECDYAPGDPARVSITLNDEVVDVAGEVLSIRTLGMQRGVDVIITYALVETVAQAVRRYVFARQMAERRARQNAD